MVNTVVLRGFMLNGEVPKVGSIVEVSDHQGRALIGSNKAEAVSDQAKKQSIGSLKIGFIDFEVHQHRFPRL